MGALAAQQLLRGPALAVSAAASRHAIEECDRGDVVLLPGRARAQADATLEALLAMDEDKLLRPFREAAGMPVGADRFGGWYDASPEFHPPSNMTGFIPGHSFGQYVSALARGYAATGDVRAKAKVGRLLAGFAPTISPDFYRDYPLPAYTYDKIVIGLLDAHRFADDRQAFALLGRATDAVLPFLPARAIDRRVAERTTRPNIAFGWDETYTLPENLYLAAELGAGERYRAMARRYLLDATYFDPLAAGHDVLAGRHAYSHVNALASALAAWRTDGDPKHLAAARNGLGFVIDQSFATGGWGPSEGLIAQGSGKLGDSLAGNHGSFEAPCGSYGHFKVARGLIRATGDSRYGDSIERLFYNAALGLLPLRSNGEAFYYADYSDAGAKTYYPQRCPCCSGTIGQLTADYGISAHLRDRHGLYVNLYTPSRAVWRRDGESALTLTQRGDYPLSDAVTMQISAQRPVRMALRLRIPAWAGPRTRLAVNGRAVAGILPGRFATVTREWRDGDRVDLAIDRTVRMEAVDAQHPDRIAAMQGPLALFATGGPFANLRSGQLRSLRQREPGGTDWVLDAAATGPVFKPWFAIGTEPTRLYQMIV
jgi:hypothetical protein